MKYTVKQGVRYYAQIKLSGFEALASNDQIAEKLKAAGFSDVLVTGNGANRGASATWLGKDATADIPSEIYHVEIIGSVTGGGKALEDGTGGGAG